MSLRNVLKKISIWVHTPPEIVRAALSSPFAAWLRHCCLPANAAVGKHELVRDLYDNYLNWCRITGLPEKKRMSVRMFGLALSQRQIRTAGKTRDGLQYRTPIRLRQSIYERPVFVTHPSEAQSEQTADPDQARLHPEYRERLHNPPQGPDAQDAPQASSPAQQATPPSRVQSDPPASGSDAPRSQSPSRVLTPAAFVAAVRALLALTEHPDATGKPWKGVEQ